MSLRHFPHSSAKYCGNSSGDPATRIRPASRSGLVTFGDSNAFFIAVLSLRMTESDVPAGTNKATSVVDWNPGTVSAIVGTFDRSADRSVVLAPSIRSRPDSATGRAVDRSTNPTLVS